MTRSQDTPGLFGGGVGSNNADDGVKCIHCGKYYPKAKDENDTVSYVFWCGGKVVECCYEKVENEVLINMKLIIPWFTKLLKKKNESNEGLKKLVAIIKRYL